MAAPRPPRSPPHSTCRQHRAAAEAKGWQSSEDLWAETPQLRLRLTCVDASDDVSLLRTGTIWDPRLLSLLQPKDQIRLGDWVSWGRTRGSCRPRLPPHSPAPSQSSPGSSLLFSVLPGPGVPTLPRCGKPHIPFSPGAALALTALLPGPSPHLHLRVPAPLLHRLTPLPSGLQGAYSTEARAGLPRTCPPGSHTPQGSPLCQEQGHPCFPAPPSPRPRDSKSHLSDS